jgi:hypothetical protein
MPVNLSDLVVMEMETFVRLTPKENDISWFRRTFRGGDRGTRLKAIDNALFEFHSVCQGALTNPSALRNRAAALLETTNEYYIAHHSKDLRSVHKRAAIVGLLQRQVRAFTEGFDFRMHNHSTDSQVVYLDSSAACNRWRVVATTVSGVEINEYHNKLSRDRPRMTEAERQIYDAESRPPLANDTNQQLQEADLDIVRSVYDLPSKTGRALREAEQEGRRPPNFEEFDF